jgi:NDP-sugar pyrophosphorylase family protein
MTTDLVEVVGLVPVAGRANRLSPLPCSKEIYPVGFTRQANGEPRPRVASHHLFQKFGRAGASRAYVILRNGKWDIPAYFGDGGIVGMAVAYVVIDGSLGPPDTLDRAYPFVANNSVAFGFPDILFGPDDVFEQLLRKLREERADVVLGLYVAHDTTQMDMIGIDADGRVQMFVLKPRRTELRYTWVCAVWTPAFTRFMHAFLDTERHKQHENLGTGAVTTTAYAHIDAQGDLPLGAVMKAAVDEGLPVYGRLFPHETYIDIGTPNQLFEAMRSSVAE